jgi:hypothetical protein
MMKCRRLRHLTINVAEQSNWQLKKTYGDALDRIAWLRPEHLVKLAPLNLQSLRVEGRNVLADDIAQLLAATNLEQLDLSHASLTPDEIAKLQKSYPATKVRNDWVGPGAKSPPDNLPERIASERMARAAR